MKNRGYLYIRYKVLSPVCSRRRLSEKLIKVIKTFSEYHQESIQISKLGDAPYDLITQKNISDYLEKVSATNRQGIATATILSTADEKFSIFLAKEKYDQYTYDCLWFSLNTLISDFPIINNLASLLDLLVDIFNAFRGKYAFTEDEFLSKTYYTKSSYANAIKNIPVELSPFVQKPDDSINSYKLPSLPAPNKIDIQKIPIGIWWINFFSNQQLNNIGFKKILKQDWFIAKKISDTHHLMVLTELILNIQKPAHLKKLRKVITKLEFLRVQRKFL